jgi:membrane protein DedA with SNARE-associated domain
MSFRRFMLASTLATGAWTALLAGAGYKLGENYTDINKILGPASNAVLVVLIAGYIYRVWTHRHMPVGEDASTPDLTSL